MDFNWFDISTFIGFLAIVIGVSLYASRKEETTEDYFLAGRSLTWWMIGISLIASNISTEHFIGMAGQGFTEVGLAIASYEWIAAFTLILVAWFFLPRFLRSGIYTIPEYLEHRYDKATRTLMAGFMLLFYVSVTIATVLYAGAVALKAIFDLEIYQGVWLIGIVAGFYTVYGGLKAVVWTDVVQGLTLMIGGLVVTILGFKAIGGIDNFLAVADDRLHTVLPADHPTLPWVAVFFGGMWIPNIFYWGLNQFITQRALAAKNLEEGQKGVLFGATLKLIIPFIVVFPGIIAFELFGDQIEDGDQAYPYLISHVLPGGMVGIMFAALFGATMSTLDSLLNSAATIFTIDIYKSWFKKEAPSKHYVKIGRIATLVLVVIACIWAPIVSSFEGGLYLFIQLYWGFIQPGIVAAFFMGILWKKVPPKAAFIGILLNLPVYGFLLWAFPDTAFLHHMFISLVVILIFMTGYTLAYPFQHYKPIPVVIDHPIKVSMTIKVWSVLIIIATVSLYIIFY